jgi:ribosomal protein uL24
VISSRLTKGIIENFNVCSLPVRMGNQVKFMVRHKKDTKGKEKSVDRRRKCILIEEVVLDKENGQQAPLPANPSSCVVTALKL